MMRKKMLVLISAFVLSVVGTHFQYLETQAQENVEVQEDYSYLFAEDTLLGTTGSQPYGLYLSSGTSGIRDAGVGKIAAGGATIAARKCDVSLNVIVERLSGGKWYRVTSWTAELKNTWSVASEKVLSVTRGYYYRVRCLHSAHTDASSSWTGNLWR